MAGVSIATVSRVINRSGPVGDEAETRARHAVIETRFRANRFGRGLKTAKSHAVGVLIPSLRNPVFAEAVEGVQSAAEELGYNVLLTSSRYSSERELHAVETLLENRVDGVLLTVADETRSAALRLLREESCPFVLLFNPTPDGEAGVTIDNAAAAERLVASLIERGHRRIDMIVGAFRQSDRSRPRQLGYERALAHAGVPRGKIVEADLESPDLAAKVHSLLAASAPPTALFCSTDMLAIAAMRALAQIGRRVPEDVAVAGFDGVAIGEWVTPSLATVVQPAEAIGRTALGHLIDRIERRAAPRRILLPYQMRAGDSLGPCR